MKNTIKLLIDFLKDVYRQFYNGESKGLNLTETQQKLLFCENVNVRRKWLFCQTTILIIVTQCLFKFERFSYGNN